MAKKGEKGWFLFGINGQVVVYLSHESKQYILQQSQKGLESIKVQSINHVSFDFDRRSTIRNHKFGCINYVKHLKNSKMKTHQFIVTYLKKGKVYKFAMQILNQSEIYTTEQAFEGVCKVYASQGLQVVNLI